MKNIYQIDSQIYDLLTLPESEIVDEDGVVIRDVWSELEALQGERTDKLINSMRVAQEMDETAKALDEEIARLTVRQKYFEARAKKIREHVAISMNNANEKRVENSTARITLTRSKEVKIIDETELPLQFLRTKTTVKADKKAIGEKLKAGEEVPGARLVENLNVRLR